MLFVNWSNQKTMQKSRQYVVQRMQFNLNTLKKISINYWNSHSRNVLLWENLHATLATSSLFQTTKKPRVTVGSLYYRTYRLALPVGRTSVLTLSSTVVFAREKANFVAQGKSFFSPLWVLAFFTS